MILLGGTGVNGRKVVDYDFGALVYPKWIKVVSGSEVVSASVNFNEGGGSGNGSSESSGEAFTFFDVKGKIPDNTMATLYGYIVKIDNGETQDVLSGSYAYSLVGLENISKKWVAMGIPNNTLILNPSGGGLINSDEIMSMFEAKLGWTRITKDEFYNLEA